MNTLIKAANVPEVEPIWATLFAKALEGKDVKEMLTNVGSGGGAAAAAPAAGGAAAGGAAEAAAPAEEAKEEGTFQLFRFGFSRLTTILQKRKSPTRTWDSVSSTKRASVFTYCPLYSPRLFRDKTKRKESSIQTTLAVNAQPFLPCVSKNAGLLVSSLSREGGGTRFLHLKSKDNLNICGYPK